MTEHEQGSDRTTAASGPAASGQPAEPLQPLAVDTARVVLVGLAVWALALVLTLAVPSLRTGERDWWPWACVTGLVLGGLGLAYLRRGRGNAAAAGD